MTKTEQFAYQYAFEHYTEYSTDGGWSTESDYEAIRAAYEDGAKDMLERACEWLRRYNTGVRGEEFINEFCKAIEE